MADFSAQIVCKSRSGIWLKLGTFFHGPLYLHICRDRAEAAEAAAPDRTFEPQNPAIDKFLCSSELSIRGF